MRHYQTVRYLKDREFNLKNLKKNQTISSLYETTKTRIVSTAPYMNFMGFFNIPLSLTSFQWAFWCKFIWWVWVKPSPTPNAHTLTLTQHLNLWTKIARDKSFGTKIRTMVLLQNLFYFRICALPEKFVPITVSLFKYISMQNWCVMLECEKYLFLYWKFGLIMDTILEFLVERRFLTCKFFLLLVRTILKHWLHYWFLQVFPIS